MRAIRTIPFLSMTALAVVLVILPRTGRADVTIQQQTQFDFAVGKGVSRYSIFFGSRVHSTSRSRRMISPLCVLPQNIDMNPSQCMSESLRRLSVVVNSVLVPCALMTAKSN